MLFRSLGLSVVLAAMGCGSSGSGTGSDAPSGHTLTLNAKLNATNGEVSFVTPSASLAKIPVSEVVGKPYLVQAYPAGFSPGNDPPLDWKWGKMPADLTVHWTTPAHYQDGPYDMLVVVFTSTPVSDAQMAGNGLDAPTPKPGELASVNLDTTLIRPGDPKLGAGQVRVVVDGKDAEISVENRPPADMTNQDQLKLAFRNVIMMIP
jgi:hypothetical protein